MARLAQSLAELFYAVAVDDDSMPAVHTHTHSKRLLLCFTLGDVTDTPVQYLLNTVFHHSIYYILMLNQCGFFRCAFTQKLHNAFDIFLRDAAGVQGHSGPDGWCQWWPPGCQAGSRKQMTWPPRLHPPTSHRPRADRKHGNCGWEQCKITTIRTNYCLIKAFIS